MKSLLTIFSLFCLVGIYAQKASTVNRVEYMAVYPGCEEFSDSKRESIQCFGRNLSNDVIRFLDTTYPITAETIDKDRIATQIQFVVSKNGYLEDIKMVNGDKIFETQSVEAYEKLGQYLKENNLKIQPAKMADGTAVDIIFQNSMILQNNMDEKERKEEKKKLGIQSS